MIRKKLSLILFILIIGAIMAIISCTTKNDNIKADKIITNAKIYTSNKDNLYATSCVIKNGKFIYVGDESGLDKYEGEKVDMKGKFIMPSIIDGHAHIPLSIMQSFRGIPIYIHGNNKSECLEFIKNSIKENPGKEEYSFILNPEYLKGEKFGKDDLDSISTSVRIIVCEPDMHSLWGNTKLFKDSNVPDNPKDIVPGLSMYGRDENGNFNGYVMEMACAPLGATHVDSITDEQILSVLNKFFDFCKEYGVATVFDAGTPGSVKFHERVYKILCDLDRQGKLPITVEGCYFVITPDMFDTAIENLKRYSKIYNTKHVKVRTLKVITDGVLESGTAAMIDPYVDRPNFYGGSLFDNFDLVSLLKELNKEGFNFHAHTVGERAVKQVLDSVEKVKNEIGDQFKINVTCAHIEHAKDEDLKRFGPLGVMADFTPWWSNSNILPLLIRRLGEKRAYNKFKSKTVANSGALVGYSSDNITFRDFREWNPYLGMEIGMTRFPSEKSLLPDNVVSKTPFPPVDECMTFDEMMQGYTSINSVILDLPNKGSIAVGKDADYLVFDKDLSKAEHEGFSYNKPVEVYFEGVRQH